MHINTRQYVKMGLIELKNEHGPPIWRSFFAVFLTVRRKLGKGMGTMLKILRERARLELERQLRPYRRARKDPRPPEGWLRAMRLAVFWEEAIWRAPRMPPRKIGVSHY